MPQQDIWFDKKLTSTKVKTERIRFKGGYNTETPPLEMPPGFAIDANNFEVAINGGYLRIGGCERYDGRPRPSEQKFFTLPATITSTPTLNDIITGITSGVTSSYLGQTSTGFLIAQASGNYIDTEDLQVAAASVGTCTGVQYAGGAGSIPDDANFTNLAADVYRADIAKPPGAGSVTGIHIYKGIKYAFRNNVGNTFTDMWKNSSSGWVQVALGVQLHFDAGLSAGINVGDTLDGAGGAQGVITGIAVRTGSFTGNDAVGLLTFVSVTGTFVNDEVLTVSATPVATCDGTQANIELEANGRFQFEDFNFTGDAGTLKMYGCDGVSRGFEFDGTTFIPVETGMATDTPDYVTAHKYHLFFGFDGSLQHSGPGTPFAWTPVLGASELGLGDTITGMYPQVGSLATSTAGASSVLLIMTRHRTFTLYGTSVSDWNLIETEHEAGGVAYTMDKIGFTYMLDDRGIRSFGSTDRFGNFEQATLTRYIQTYLSPKIPNAIDSHISKEKNQYRIFFNDKTALYITVDNNKIVGMMPILLKQQVVSSTSGEETDGTEGIYFGGDDGFVYQMEKGTSFDGQTIDWRLQLAYDHIKSPNIKKRYHKCSLEIKGDSYVTLDFSYLLDYQATETAQPGASEVVTVNLASFVWDNFTWDQFYWDGRTLAPASIKLHGRAENISLLMSGESEITAPFTLTGAIIHYSMGKRERS